MQKGRNEWQVNPPIQQHGQLMPASRDGRIQADKAHWGIPSTKQHPFNQTLTSMRYQTLTPIIGDLPEISVTLICLALTAEDLPSIWTLWLPELRGKLPLRQATRGDELALSLASKLRRTGLPQKHYPIIFWIIFPDTRFGKKMKKKEMKNGTSSYCRLQS